MDTSSLPEPVERLENPRPLFPGEPWFALAAGIGAWLLTRRNPSLAVRSLGTFFGATLVARAAHGRRRLGKVMRWTPIGGDIRRG